MPKINPDKQWQLFNKQLEKLMKSGDLFGLGTTYYEIADFLRKEGKDNSQFRKLGYQMKLKLQNQELKEYKKSGVVKVVEVLATENSCKLCKKLNGKTFTLEEAQTIRPLPVENCTYHPYGCRCGYIPVIE